MSIAYTAEQLQAAYDRAYADVRREYAEDLPALLATVNCETVEELVRSYRNMIAWAKLYGLPVSSVPNTRAVTAVTATRDALARLWLPPDEIVVLAQRAAAAGCLSDDARHWLRRIENERRRQKKSPAGEGEAVG